MKVNIILKIAYFIVQRGAGGVLGTIESLPTQLVHTVDLTQSEQLCKKFDFEIWNVPEIKNGEVEKKGRERKRYSQPKP